MAVPVVAWLVLLLELLASSPAGAQFIPPGNEQVLAAMLGSGTTLPGGCTFAGGQVDRQTVSATYQCAAGEVRLQLSHPSVGPPGAIGTDRFALAVVGGSPDVALLRAIETSIRSKERDFHWNTPAVDDDDRWAFPVVLSGLALVAAVSGWRTRGTEDRIAPRAVIEAAIVAAAVATWLQIDGAPPAHTDSAIDVALARDCIRSAGATCAGHASSALGLLQGQAFTYALAAWLRLGLSMGQLSLLAAATLGAATGLLHHATARRFGDVAWLVSAFIGGLAADMAGYPIMWNPTWFPLPLSIAFVATLAITHRSGAWFPFVAGVAFALTEEAHVLFGAFVGVAAGLLLLTAERAVSATAMLLASFVLVELVVSQQVSTLNAIVLRSWLGAHLVPAATIGVLSLLSIPMLVGVRRHLRRRDSHTRERFVVLVWLLAGLVAIGFVLPWAASRPPQIRYYGAGLPAIAWAAGWLCHRATGWAQPATVRGASRAVFVAVFALRIGLHGVLPRWLMDDGHAVAVASNLVGTSAMDTQMMLRPVPAGALGQVVAAFDGTASVPVFPPQIVRAILATRELTLPDGWRRIRLAQGDAFVSTIDAWSQPEEAEVCPEPRNGERCVRLERADFEEVARQVDGAVHRMLGVRIERAAVEIGGWVQRGARALLWRLPLRPLGGDEPRVFVASDAPSATVASVDGATWTALGPARALIERPQPGASITVRTLVEGKYEAGVPPTPLELSAEEARLLAPALPPGT